MSWDLSASTYRVNKELGSYCLNLPCYQAAGIVVPQPTLLPSSLDLSASTYRATNELGS
jgi:hypothetical protein